MCDSAPSSGPYKPWTALAPTHLTADGTACFDLGYPEGEPSGLYPLREVLEHARRTANIDLIGRCASANAFLYANARYRLVLSRNLIGDMDEVVVPGGLSWEEATMKAAELDAIWFAAHPDAQFGARRFHLRELLPQPALVRIPVSLQPVLRDRKEKRGGRN